MRTDADVLAYVRDPTSELLLSHTATLTDEWCSRPRPRSRGKRASDGSVEQQGRYCGCASGALERNASPSICGCQARWRDAGRAGVRLR